MCDLVGSSGASCLLQHPIVTRHHLAPGKPLNALERRVKRACYDFVLLGKPFCHADPSGRSLVTWHFLCSWLASRPKGILLRGSLPRAWFGVPHPLFHLSRLCVTPYLGISSPADVALWFLPRHLQFLPVSLVKAFSPLLSLQMNDTLMGWGLLSVYVSHKLFKSLVLFC